MPVNNPGGGNLPPRTNAPAAGSTQSIYDAMFGLESPTIAQYQQSTDAAETQLGDLPASLATQTGLLQEQTQTSAEQIANQLTGNTLSGQAAAQQFGITTQQNQLAGLTNTQQYQNTVGQLGLEQSLLGTQQQVAGGIQGLTQQQLGVQQGQLNYNLPLALQQQRGQAAAAGAANTVGNQQAQQTIGEQYGVNSYNLANQSQQSALNYQGQQAGFTEQAGQYGIQGTAAQEQEQNTAAGLALTQQGQSLAEGATQAQLANTAAGLGISVQQLQQQLHSGINQIGLSGQVTQDQLLQQAAQGEAGQSQGLGAVLSNIGALTGAGPQAFTNSFPNLYGGSTPSSTPYQPAPTG